MTVYGLKTCATTKKAVKFYEGLNVPSALKDYKEVPPSKALLAEALKKVGSPAKLFNTSGASYKEGGFKTKVATMKKDEVIAAMIADPMLIKRPIVKAKKGIVVGFDEAALKDLA